MAAMFRFIFTLLSAAVVVAGVGCSKQEGGAADAEPTALVPSAPPPVLAPVSPEGAFTPRVVADAMGPFQRDLESASPDSHLRALNAALTFWLAAGRPFPQDVSEFVTAKLITSVPAAPAGKRFVLDAATQQIFLAP